MSSGFRFIVLTQLEYSYGAIRSIRKPLPESPHHGNISTSECFQEDDIDHEAYRLPQKDNDFLSTLSYNTASFAAPEQTAWCGDDCHGPDAGGTGYHYTGILHKTPKINLPCSTAKLAE